MATTAPTFQSEKEKITVTNKSRDSMAKKLKIEGIDAVGILNSIRPVSEPLKEIPRVENTTETNESNNRRTALDIDEVRCLAYIKENPISKQLETKRKKTEAQNMASELTIQSEVSTPDELTKLTNPVKPPIQKRLALSISPSIKETPLNRLGELELEIIILDTHPSEPRPM